MNQKLKKIKELGLIKLKEGQATGAMDFFEQIIKPQFEKNEDVIRTIHKALIKYIKSDDVVYAVRLYFSYKKVNYDRLRRGFLTVFPDGKKMLFCDNTFAMPFAALKLHGEDYTYEELIEYMNQSNVLCGFSTTEAERKLAYYSCNSETRINLNKEGWYLAHILPVGYGYKKGAISSMIPNPDRGEWENSDDKVRYVRKSLPSDVEDALRAHFLRLVHPLNSFVVPKQSLLKYEGKNIGEEIELIDIVRDYIQKRFPEEYNELSKFIQAHENNNLKDHTTDKIGIIVWTNSKGVKKKKVSKNNSKSTSKNVLVSDKDKEPSKTGYTATSVWKSKDDQLKKLLNACGKQAFVNYLFPSLSKDTNVTVQDIARLYPECNDFSANSQNTRLSKARTIFKNGWEYDALEIIADSRADPQTRQKAKELLEEYNS